MKLNQIFLILILFNIISSEFINKNKLIYSPFFHQENFGKVHRIFYKNEKEDSNLILISDDSISSVNLAKKEINYRKKVNQRSEIVNLDSKNFFVTQPQSSTVEVFRTETGQFINSLDILSKNNLLYNVKSIKIKEFTLTIFVAFKSLIMQSKKKIIFEKNFVKEDAEESTKKDEKKIINLIFDLYIDEENQFIEYGLIVKGELKIYKITFDSLYKAILSKTKSEEEDEETESDDDEDDVKKEKKKKKIEKMDAEEEEIFSRKSEHGVLKGFITKEILYIYDGRSVYGYNIKGKKMEMFGLMEKYMTWEVWGFYNSNSLLLKGQRYFYYFLNGEISFQYDTKAHIACSISNMPSQRLYCYLEDQTSDKNLVAYWPNKEGKLDREFYTIDNLVKIYSDANTLDRVRLIEVNPNNNKIFSIVTTNRIIEYKITDEKYVELIAEMENNYEKYITSELFLYKPENSKNNIFESYSQYQDYYTTINTLKGNVNLLKIIKTLVKIIIDDLTEIFNSIYKLFLALKNAIIILINKKTLDLGKEREALFRENKAFLFLVTEFNLFKVLDAYTGKILFIQQFPKNQKIRIVRDSDITQRYVSILFGKRNFFVYDLKYNKFINDISSVINKLNLTDDLLINEEQLTVIMKSFLSMIKDNPIYDLKKYNLDEKIFGPKKEKVALYVDYEKSSLYILKFYINKKNEQKLILLHSFNFGNLIAISNPKFSEDINQYHLSEGKIFYKFINNDLYYILSSEKKENIKEENDLNKKPKERLILTILDGKNGKILEEKIIENIDISSVRYLFHENIGIISYTKINKGFKRNEILSFELMNKNVEYSLFRLIKNKFFTPKKESKAKKEEENNENEIEIILKTFILDRGIKALSLSKSKYNKANKYVLIVLDNNDLQLINRDELSPRRPNMIKIKGNPTFDPETNSIYADKELPGYNPVINLKSSNTFINKDKIDVYKINTAEGENESSFITCIVGGNVECTEMYPDKLYDKLSPEFKKELLVAITFGFVIFIFFFRRYHLKSEFKKIFLGNNK